MMAAKTAERADVYQIVTDTIVEAIENAGQWQRPWKTGNRVTTNWTDLIVGARPRNVRGSLYKGINYFLLSAIAGKNGWSTPVWGTYKAWAEIKGQVRKGERGSPCVFWKFIREEKDGKVQTIPMARMYTVFNIAQVDGVDAGRFEKPVVETPIVVDAPEVVSADCALTAEVQAYFRVQSIKVVDGGNSAFYHPLMDYVGMPDAASFISTVTYASTLAHEAAHSTGHAARLDRRFGSRFGDEAYAVEEVVAELAAAMVLAAGGHDYEVQHAASYLKNWLSVLKNDKRAVFTAASAAEKAASLILGASDEATDSDEESE